MGNKSKSIIFFVMMSLSAVMLAGEIFRIDFATATLWDVAKETLTFFLMAIVFFLSFRSSRNLWREEKAAAEGAGGN